MQETNNNNLHECSPKIFSKIEGYNHTSNDVILFKSKHLAKFNLIYFGGDIQDYPDEMKKSINSRDFTQWNLLNTGSLLNDKFSSSLDTAANIIIIRADYFHLKCFANYSNFLLSTDFGVPIGEEQQIINSDESNSNSSTIDRYNEVTLNKIKCWLHMQKLYENSIKNFNNELKSGENSIDPALPIILCGFSKGCIILNQLCHELTGFDLLLNEYKTEIGHMISFSKQIRHLIWLDGGHSGTSNSWITKEEIILLIKSFNWSCYVFVTPYQIKSRKFWAIEEYNKFIDLLKSSNVNAKSVYYFEDKEDDYDVDIHFEVLRAFDTNLI